MAVSLSYLLNRCNMDTDSLWLILKEFFYQVSVKFKVSLKCVFIGHKVRE